MRFSARCSTNIVALSALTLLFCTSSTSLSHSNDTFFVFRFQALLLLFLILCVSYRFDYVCPCLRVMCGCVCVCVCVCVHVCVRVRVFHLSLYENAQSFNPFVHSDSCHSFDNPARSIVAANTNTTARSYLNDPNNTENVGGEVYLARRDDVANDSTTPLYSGPGLVTLLRHTVMVRPHCGNLILFTSDARNPHGTLPIESGVRYAVPMWFSDIDSMPHRRSSNDIHPKGPGDQSIHRWVDDFLQRVVEECPSFGQEHSLPSPSGLLELGPVSPETCDEWIGRLYDIVGRKDASGSTPDLNAQV